MNNRWTAVCTILIGLLSVAAMPLGGWACGPYGLFDLDSLQEELHKEQPNIKVIAADYRQLGRSAFEELLALRERLLEDDPDIVTQLERLIDQVGGQRHASHSRLYWYTDFEQAQSDAKSAGKPILSLRLLGNLDEQYSCANSRFFRTTLYANENISKLLREDFVLHWQSVRPVPKVTIDFGDGRKLQRTVTGNSIHYVVSPGGVILEALPGLYSADAFQNWLQRSSELHQRVAGAKNQTERREMLVSFHTDRNDQILARWWYDLRQTVAAAPRKARKAVRHPTFDELVAKTDDAMWELFAASDQLGEAGTLDQASIRLIRSENPAAGEAQGLSISKSVAEDPIFELVRNLERTIQIDSIRNEYLLHSRIHQRLAEFANGKEVADVQEMAYELELLNEWAYADLFRSPLHDPWLGLLPAATYNALDNGGATGNESAFSALLLPTQPEG